jgi:hypothetical protein
LPCAAKEQIKLTDEFEAYFERKLHIAGNSLSVFSIWSKRFVILQFDIWKKGWD